MYLALFFPSVLSFLSPLLSVSILQYKEKCAVLSFKNVELLRPTLNVFASVDS